METRPRFRTWWVPAVVAIALLAACGDSDDGESASGTATTTASETSDAAQPDRFACLDFEARVVSGPNAGKVWTGDLVLNVDKTGLFSGDLVPSQYVDRDKLEVKDKSKAICRAVGQRNGAQVSWFLYCQQGERIFGTGQVTTTDDGGEELRGITSGPADADTGIYHGRNYPPYIRTISGDFS